MGGAARPWVTQHRAAVWVSARCEQGAQRTRPAPAARGRGSGRGNAAERRRRQGLATVRPSPGKKRRPGPAPRLFRHGVTTPAPTRPHRLPRTPRCKCGPFGPSARGDPWGDRTRLSAPGASARPLPRGMPQMDASKLRRPCGSVRSHGVGNPHPHALGEAPGAQVTLRQETSMGTSDRRRGVQRKTLIPPDALDNRAGATTPPGPGPGGAGG